MKKYVRQILAYKHYFIDFYRVQPTNVQKKIEWTIELIRILKFVPNKYFKHIEGIKSLYEIRVEFNSNAYRIFSFFDEDNLIILGNAFIKKTQKTPKEEIDKALKIKKKDFDEKE